MPGITKPERRAHPASDYIKIGLNHPGGFQVARRRAIGGVGRPILPKRLWKHIPNWIALYAERGVAKKCWEGCALLPATHDGRRYGGCQIRGCTSKPQPGAPIHACTKCRWSVCEKCADRPRMPTLAQDPLFHGPDDPCMLMYPQFTNMVGRGTVIVCPGGNYEFLSPLEGLPVVEWLAQHGIGAVVLRYRLLPDYCLDDCLDDLEAAAHRIRGMRPGPVAALGFSAGGHLIASLGLRSAKRKQPQPLDAQVLVYPGIDGRDWHSPEYNGFFNKGRWRIPKRAQSLHAYQDDLLGGPGFAAPPTCLVGSTEDTCTPNEQHTDVFHAALEERDIPNVYLRDAFGEHGFELKGGWTPGCVKWLHSRGFGSHSQVPGVHKMALRRPAPRTGLSDAGDTTNQLPGLFDFCRPADSDDLHMPLPAGEENSSPRFPPPPIEPPPFETSDADSRAADMAAAQRIAKAMNLSAVTDSESLWACTPAPQVRVRRTSMFLGKTHGRQDQWSTSPALRQVLSCAARLTSHAATKLPSTTRSCLLSPVCHQPSSSHSDGVRVHPLCPPRCAPYTRSAGDARHGQVWQGARRQLAARHADVVAALLRDHHRLVGLDHHAAAAPLLQQLLLHLD